MRIFFFFASRAVTALSHLMGAVAGIALIFLIISATLDVTYRALTGSNLFYGLLEYGEIALVTLAFLGAVQTHRAGGHVSSSLVTGMMPLRARAAVRAIALVCVATLLCWAAYAASIATIQAFNAGEVRFGLVRIPMWPARGVVPVSLGLLACLYLRDSLRLCRLACGANPPAGNREDTAQKQLSI